MRKNEVGSCAAGVAGGCSAVGVYDGLPVSLADGRRINRYAEKWGVSFGVAVGRMVSLALDILDFNESGKVLIVGGKIGGVL